MPTTSIVGGGNNGVLSAETATAPETLNGPLTLANQLAAPATPAGGVVLYPINGVLTYTNPQGLQQTIVGSQGGLQSAATAITGGVAEAALMSMSLPALDAIPGAVYKQVGYGVFSTTGSPGSTVLTSRLGGIAGTTLATSAGITLGTSLTNAQWKIEALLNFLTATTAECVLEVLINSAAAGAASTYLVAATAAVTVSLSTAKVWVVDITPGATGNSIQLLGGWSERVC